MKSIKQRGRELVALAKQLAAEGLDHVQLSNSIFPVGGPVNQRFPTRKEREEFIKTEEWRELHRIVNQAPEPEPVNVPSGTVNVRIAQSLHAALNAEADREGVSLNALVSAKLAVSLGVSTALALQRRRG